jgi:hypothetical protein
MRTQVTATRLRDVKLHAFRDRNGNKHVTGLTIHGALVIPTRTFWIALAEIGAQGDACFGDEYETYKKCILAIGDRELYFSVTVDEDGNALLDDVTDSAVVRAHGIDRCALICAMFAGRRGALNEEPPAPCFDLGPAASCQGDDTHVADSDWPLLATPLPGLRDLWGWESFLRLPSDDATLMDSPTGTARPSVN